MYYSLWKLSNIPPAWAAVFDSGSFFFRRPAALTQKPVDFFKNL